jgi:hypothetical protein
LFGINTDYYYGQWAYEGQLVVSRSWWKLGGAAPRAWCG